MKTPELKLAIKVGAPLLQASTGENVLNLILKRRNSDMAENFIKYTARYIAKN